jgi:hypothetical protein
VRGAVRGVRGTHESPIKKSATCKTLTHKDAEPFGDVSVSILRDVRNFPSAVTIFCIESTRSLVGRVCVCVCVIGD